MTTDEHQRPPAASLFGDDALSTALAALVRELGIGAKLPSERELSERLGVSRTALRDRLALLEGLGAVRRQTGSGTYVAELKPETLALALSLGLSSAGLPLEAMESVRIALERQAAREACRASDPVLIAYMRQALDTMEATENYAEVMEADRAFHQSLLRASGNPALVFFADVLSDTLARSLADRSERLSQRALEGAVRQLLVDYHSPIYAAILEGDEQAAMVAVDQHFQVLSEVLASGGTLASWPSAALDPA